MRFSQQRTQSLSTFQEKYLRRLVISHLRKSAQSVDKIGEDNPQISQIRTDFLYLIVSLPFQKTI